MKGLWENILKEELVPSKHKTPGGRRSAEQRGKATSPSCLNRTTQPNIGLEKLGKDHFPHSATCSVCVSLRVRQKANIRAKDDTTPSNHRHPSMNPISGCSKKFFRAAHLASEKQLCGAQPFFEADKHERALLSNNAVYHSKLCNDEAREGMKQEKLSRKPLLMHAKERLLSWAEPSPAHVGAKSQRA